MRALGVLLLLLLSLAGIAHWVVQSGRLGAHQGPGEVTEVPIPKALLEARSSFQRASAAFVGVAQPKQIPVRRPPRSHPTRFSGVFPWYRARGPIHPPTPVTSHATARPWTSGPSTITPSGSPRSTGRRRSTPFVSATRSQGIRRTPMSSLSSAGSGHRSGLRRRITTDTRTSYCAILARIRCRYVPSLPGASLPRFPSPRAFPHSSSPRSCLVTVPTSMLQRTSAS